jgi:hypothetical protein
VRQPIQQTCVRQTQPPHRQDRGCQVGTVVLPRQRQLPGAPVQLELAACAGGVRSPGPAVICRVAPEGGHTAAGPPPPFRKAGTVGIEHRHPGLRQRVQQLPLATDHAFQGAELGQMRLGGVGDDADVGPSDRGQGRDLARGRGSDFQHAVPVLAAQAQDRQWQSQRIVQIAAGGVAGSGRTQGRGDQVLGRRLAVAAGDRNQVDLPLHPAPAARQMTQGRLRIGTQQDESLPRSRCVFPQQRIRSGTRPPSGQSRCRPGHQGGAHKGASVAP